MDDYLYYLAKQKFDQYNKLNMYPNGAFREEECIDRIKLIHKYEMLLEVISMLPLEHQIRMTNIEKHYFEDAPYVSK